MRIGQRLLVLVLSCGIACAALPAFAQGGRAEINGTVVDAQKAVLPGATITVTNEDTGLVRESVTDATGRYVVPSLLPGTYTVKADLSGFQPLLAGCIDDGPLPDNDRPVFQPRLDGGELGLRLFRHLARDGDNVDGALFDAPPRLSGLPSPVEYVVHGLLVIGRPIDDG